MWQQSPSYVTSLGASLSGVKRDADFRIKPVKERDHLHLQRVIVHGDVSVLGHHEINSGNARIGGSYFKAEQRLREYLLLSENREAPDRESEFPLCSRRSAGLAAQCSRSRRKSFGLIESARATFDIFAQTLIEKRLAEFCEIFIQPISCAIFDCVAEGRRIHQFEVLLVLRGGARGYFVEPFTFVAFGGAATKNLQKS